MPCYSDGLILHLESLKFDIMETDDSDTTGEVFYLLSSEREIVLPDGMTEIPNGAFTACEMHGHIRIGRGVERIGDYAFSLCRKLKSVEITDSVKHIGFRAFSGCFSLERIVISNSVTRICDFAFEHCRSLKEIVIPDKVKTIGRGMFNGCRSLESITLPGSVASIHEKRVDPTKSMKGIVVPKAPGDDGYDLQRDIDEWARMVSRYYIGGAQLTVFDDCLSLKNIFIPKGSMGRFKLMLPIVLHHFLKEI